jgi:hypothetical protein
MLGALALAATAQASPQVQAKATIRVLTSGIGSPREWERAPKWQRGRIIIKGESGRPVTIRVIEFQ